MKSGLPIAAFFAACCTLASAQTTVYESKDKAGPVFSDMPSPGAKPVEVAPPNLSQGVTPQQPVPAAAAPYYASLAISNPANEGTIHSNTGAFDVRIQISPALRSGAGDVLKIKLDGNLLKPRYSSGRIAITAADWNAAATDNVAHTLQAAVVDRRGNVLIESAPVTFYAHRATVNSGKR